MKLYEYQGRQVFERFGIPTPSGVVVSSMQELDQVRGQLKYPLVIKAQVLVGGSTLAPEARKQISDIISKLVRAFREMDAELLEINPMAITPQGKVVAADAKVVLDDDAAWRHPDFEEPKEDKTPLEWEAEQ